MCNWDLKLYARFIAHIILYVYIIYPLSRDGRMTQLVIPKWLQATIYTKTVYIVTLYKILRIFVTGYKFDKLLDKFKIIIIYVYV